MKILFYDIESTPNLGYVWGRYDQTVLHFQKERELLSFAYSYLGDSKVYCITRKGKKDDKQLVKIIAKLLQEADITIAHNGDEFDRKIIKARMLYWGMKPLKINCSVDTKKAAKSYFGFNGNSLDNICKFLGIGSKMPVPGIQLWLDCMADKPRAWKKMIAYNIHDIVLLKEVYERLRPWIENHPNYTKMFNPLVGDKGCPNCGSLSVQSRGLRATVKSVQRQWNCNDCGKWYLTALSKR